MTPVPERFTWAVALLDLQPGDRVLEIGGGAGLAASLVLEHLDGGTFTGLDRSEKMVALASVRNRHAMDSGVARFVAAPVHQSGLAGGGFDKIFLINVNLHLHDAVRDFGEIKSLLVPGGKLVAVSHPPVARKAHEYVEVMLKLLRRSGFADVSARLNESPDVPMAAVIARSS